MVLERHACENLDHATSDSLVLLRLVSPNIN